MKKTKELQIGLVFALDTDNPELRRYLQETMRDVLLSVTDILKILPADDRPQGILYINGEINGR